MRQRLSLYLIFGVIVFQGGLVMRADDEGNTRPRGIDTHIHLYDPTQSVWHRPSAPARLRKMHRAADFEKATTGLPIGSSVVVEAGIDPAHNTWMLDHADESPVIAAVIGNIDLRRPEATAELRELARRSKFRGIRIRGHGPVAMGDPVVRSNLKTMESLGLVLEIRVDAKSLAEVGPVAESHPDLHIILNHLAGGRLDPAGKVADWWLPTVEGLGVFPNVFCKISALDAGFRSHRDPKKWAVLCDPLFRIFGPDRLLYGSNWPVSPKDGNYKAVYELFEAVMRTRSESLWKKILEENPRQAYHLDGLPE